VTLTMVPAGDNAFRLQTAASDMLVQSVRENNKSAA
jgi:hypothetical protein